jgi:hypothetical protein
MMTKELNAVSSRAAAWLEKLDSSSFFTPAQPAVTSLDCGGKQRTTSLSVYEQALAKNGLLLPRT